MKQREIWYASLDPTKGSEQSGTRLVVILSANMMNELLKVVIVCPITTNVKNYKGNVALEPNSANNLFARSETLIFQVRSISKFRLLRKIGDISKEEPEELKTSLNEILRH